MYDTFELVRNGSVLSLDAPIGTESTDGALDRGSMLGEEDKMLETLVDGISLQAAMTCLDARERLIITLKFFRRLSQSQVAERIGISQMHVSRLQRGALAKLRRALNG